MVRRVVLVAPLPTEAQTATALEAGTRSVEVPLFSETDGQLAATAVLSISGRRMVTRLLFDAPSDGAYYVAVACDRASVCAALPTPPPAFPQRGDVLHAPLHQHIVSYTVSESSDVVFVAAVVPGEGTSSAMEDGEFKMPVAVRKVLAKARAQFQQDLVPFRFMSRPCHGSMVWKVCFPHYVERPVELDVVVAIGTDCAAAAALRFVSLRKRSFPFDWLRCTTSAVRRTLIEGFVPSFETVVDHVPNTNLYTRRGPSETSAARSSDFLLDEGTKMVASRLQSIKFEARLARLKKVLQNVTAVGLVYVDKVAEGLAELTIDGEVVEPDGGWSGMEAMMHELRRVYPNIRHLHCFAFNALSYDAAFPGITHSCVGFPTDGQPWETVGHLVAEALPKISLTDAIDSIHGLD